jgi:outer membrane protein OmpA-like peptidoglycan-associated protein/tetratricopeptide (TPR) repeat protein
MRYSERITHSANQGKYFVIFIFLTMLFALSAVGQTNDKKLRAKAVKALQSGKYDVAQELYGELLKLDPLNADYNYEMGLAIYDEGIHRGKAAAYFEKAIVNTKTDTLADMFLFAGKAHQFGGDYLNAIENFNIYLGLMKEEGFEAEDLEEDVNRYLEMCENGKVQFENNKDFVRIENMGASINSEYADYSPVVTDDESVLLFTSRRENTTGGEEDEIDGKFMEDIYYSVNVNGEWSPASNSDRSNRFMNAEVNTDGHDATIVYAANETEFFLYREQDVWVSKLANGVWGRPSRIGGRINSEKGFEPSVFITGDEQTMFVVSDISAGYGGRDIYVTTRDENNIWKKLENLGKGINTKFDEDAPYLTPDGNTLYFASTGHNSIGDYDIFKSVLDEKGEWGLPENLGPPINTPGHDRYFVTTDDDAVGYYSSDRDGGYGETDIYRIILDCKAVSATIIRGVVFSEDQQKPTGATISIYYAENGELINDFVANSVDGKYEMRLKTETAYRFRIDAEGYLPHSGDFTVPKQCDYYSLFQEIKIDNLEDSNGRVYAQRAYINNAFFNVDQKIEEDFGQGTLAKTEEVKHDSLRGVIAAAYNPIELTNYVQMIDIIDANGVRLGTESLGEKDVAEIQTRDESSMVFPPKLPPAKPEVAAVEEKPEVVEVKEEPVAEVAAVEEKPEVVEVKEEPVAEVAAIEEVPEPEPVVVKEAAPVIEEPVEEEKIVFRNILFDFDKSFLRNESKLELNKIYSYLNTKQDVELQIDGHADWMGTDEYNMALSERRAKSALSFLVDKGLGDERLSYQFHGEKMPIAPNANDDGTDNPDGRQLNRRCEFKIDKLGTADNITLRF